MTAVVLDASAVLAILQGEHGAEAVIPLLTDARLSAVNYSEIISKLIDRNVNIDDAVSVLDKMGINVIDFDVDLAIRAGVLRTVTKNKGISLADRACLALAERDGLPAVTSDRRWASLDLSVEVRLFR